MKPAIHVGKEVHNPNYDVQLTDATGKTLGLILANVRGASDRRGILQSSMPRTAMQLAAGGNTYDDMEMPYTVEVQSSMIGGRAMDDFVKDKTRYADGFRMDTSSVNPILGPGYVVQSGYRLSSTSFDKPLTNKTDWYRFEPGPIPNKVQDLNHYYVAGTKQISAANVFLHGWVGPMEIHYNVTTGSTDINGPDYTLKYNKVVYGNGIDQWVPLALPAPLTVTDQRVNWGWGTNIPSYVLASREPTGSSYGSETSYGAAVFGANFGGQPIGFMSGLSFEASCEYRFFEYKRCLYMIKNYMDHSGCVIYRNGIRGIAASNTGINKLGIVSTNPSSFPAVIDTNAVALITSGPGDMERQNWRNVSNASGNTIYTSGFWNIAHTTATEYALLNTDYWTQVATFECCITDVLVIQDYCLFAFGDSMNIYHFRESNINNVWTTSTWKESNDANRYHHLELTQDTKGRLQIWAANADSCRVSYSWVVAYATTLVFDIWQDERTQFGVTKARLLADLAATPTTTEYVSVRNRLAYQIADVDTELAKLISYIQAGDTSSHINNMIIYGAPGIPYILKEGEIGSIDQNVYSKIPIAELQSVRSERNGRAAMAYGVYLYFNLEGGWIERYYDQRMDDVSPNQNEGLPKERQGEISKLMPYAGRWYASINAGSSGTSSVLVNNELGWHEIYRSQKVGEPITDIYVQAIPGISNPDVLWIAEGSNIYKIPVSISPTKQDRYIYYGTGLSKEQCPYVETAWADFNFKDVNKYFHSLNLFVDMPNRKILTGSEYRTYVWYKTDTTTPDQWIYLGSGNALPGCQEFPILLEGEHKATGKQIKFKIAMQSNNFYYTPRLKAWVCNAVVRFEVKKSWMLTFQLQPDTDLLGSKVIMDPNEIYDQMDTWCNSKWHAAPLRMRTNDPISDGALVFIDPPSLSKTAVEIGLNNKGSKKQFTYLASMLVFEV